MQTGWPDRYPLWISGQRHQLLCCSPVKNSCWYNDLLNIMAALEEDKRPYSSLIFPYRKPEEFHWLQRSYSCFTEEWGKSESSLSPVRWQVKGKCIRYTVSVQNKAVLTTHELLARIGWLLMEERYQKGSRWEYQQYFFINHLGGQPLTTDTIAILKTHHKQLNWNTLEAMVTQSGAEPMRQVFPYASVFKSWQMIYANQNDKTKTDRWELLI